jgi:hypothetical protein
MNFMTISIGAIVLGACFGLMVWGQKYLGEEKGRNPDGRKNGSGEGDLESPCNKCRGCVENDKTH